MADHIPTYPAMGAYCSDSHMGSIPMNDAERVFWHIRRLLGVADTDAAPDVDRVIREELETRSLARGQVNIETIRQRLRIAHPMANQ